MDDKNTNVTKSHKVLLANRKSGAFSGESALPSGGERDACNLKENMLYCLILMQAHRNLWEGAGEPRWTNLPCVNRIERFRGQPYSAVS